MITETHYALNSPTDNGYMLWPHDTFFLKITNKSIENSSLLTLSPIYQFWYLIYLQPTVQPSCHNHGDSAFFSVSSRHCLSKHSRAHPVWNIDNVLPGNFIQQTSSCCLKFAACWVMPASCVVQTLLDWWLHCHSQQMANIQGSDSQVTIQLEKCLDVHLDQPNYFLLDHYNITFPILSCCIACFCPWIEFNK